MPNLQENSELYKKIGVLQVNNRILKAKNKILVREVNDLAEQVADINCPYCGSTELLCGYPKHCSSVLNPNHVTDWG